MFIRCRSDEAGLIEGASDNRGLGHEFLRHIERTKVLLYVIDGAASEKRSPCKDLRILLNEVAQYRDDLARRRAIVFMNKSDLEGVTAVILSLQCNYFS